MKFGPVPTGAAEGGVLAHSLKLAGGRLRKGRVLRAQDIAAIAEAGIDEVILARLEPGDLGEDAAAARLAQAILPDPAAAGLSIDRAFTGRVNLRAAGPGILDVDAEKVAAINAIDPMITLATLPKWQRVSAGVMVATVKIIAYAVPGAALDAAAGAASGALALRPPRLTRAALIITEIGASGRADEKGEAAVAERLARLGVEMHQVARVDHNQAAIAAALRATVSNSELVLILTGSATSDPHDVAPAALVASGGRLERFGMPVDPGNLLFLGEAAGTPVIGLPGCARSPALNGADWVLERVVCGVPVHGDDIAAMGVGGLLKEIPTRPQPREGRPPRS